MFRRGASLLSCPLRRMSATAQHSPSLPYTLYHNPKCSKSRGTLALLEERKLTEKVEIFKYLEEGLDEPRVRNIISLFQHGSQDSLIDIVRVKEAEWKDIYQQSYAESKTDDDKIELLVSSLVAYPKLLNRPLLIDNTATPKRVQVTRPPELALKLIDNRGANE